LISRSQERHGVPFPGSRIHTRLSVAALRRRPHGHEHVSSLTRVATRFGARALAVLTVALLAAEPAQATVSEFVRSQTSVQGRAIIDAARAMPADRYGFAPQTDPTTYGELVLHVAVGNYLFCSQIGGTAAPALTQVAGNAPKDVLVKRLQDSFDYCTRALASLDDAKMAEVLDVGGVKTPRSMAILTLTGTWNVHLEMARDYLSQNGQRIPPPAP
jgi:hypothetical protein